MVRFVTTCPKCGGVAFSKDTKIKALCPQCERELGNCGLAPCWCGRCGKPSPSDLHTMQEEI
jgi:hypothetical protein